jgi:hypothetical protein
MSRIVVAGAAFAFVIAGVRQPLLASQTRS